MSDTQQRTRLGLRHVTVVPSNYERTDEGDDQPVADRQVGR